jgi:hypothetical protein
MNSRILSGSGGYMGMKRGKYVSLCTKSDLERLQSEYKKTTNLADVVVSF